MTQRIYVDRSRYESFQRCARQRYLNYHFAQIGIESVRRPLPLCVGGSVHVGLATLLRQSQGIPLDELSFELAEMHAVQDALADFAQYDKRLELPDAERITVAPGQYFDAASPEDARATAEVNKELYLIRVNEIDEYLYHEQASLVEALVRAYARRRLRPLLEQFEVLEVEREGEWKLGDIFQEDFIEARDGSTMDLSAELWFMSRPDALLRDRESNELYLLSYKTTGSWDVRKAKDAEHDMQGMSEGIEIEQRLSDWWISIRHDIPIQIGAENPMYKFLAALDAPPRILGVRYEYMLKGERWKDRDLTERFGVEMRSQKSHLIRQYVAVSVPQRGTAGYQIGDTCWSWDYVRDDGKDSSLAWQNWKSRLVENVKEWIDKLDDAAPTMSGEDSTMGLEPRLLGYRCDAQAVGVTREHPLDAVFIPPVTVYRNEDELRDLVDQLEATERRIAEGVAEVDRAAAEGDDGEVRHALNIHFPQTRRACFYPTECAFTKLCYGGEDIRRDPLTSGLYKIRVPNHLQELGRGDEKVPKT